MTDSEKKLWYKFLRLLPINFNRQKRLGNYIADFYWHKAKLVIELDGEQHYEEKTVEYDLERTKFLEKYDLMVIRFTNYDLNDNFDGICEYIENILKERLLKFGYNNKFWSWKSPSHSYEWHPPLQKGVIKKLCLRKKKNKNWQSNKS